MTFRRINEADLADFAENINDLLDGTELDAIDPNVRAALRAEIGTLPDSMRAKTAGVMVREDRRKSEVSSKNADKAAIKQVMARVRGELAANRAPKGQWELCGFEYPKQRSRYVAQDPADLSAFGYSNGVNKLVFTGNNRPAQVVYQIWRRVGADGEWAIHATTRKQSFIDDGVTPGVRYEYRVRAVAAKTVSNFSNPAVIGTEL